MQFKEDMDYYAIQEWVGDRVTADGHRINYFQWPNTYVDWEDDNIRGEVYDHLHSTWVGVKHGQWIIKGAKGEFYPCDPEIFEAKYEPVE